MGRGPRWWGRRGGEGAWGTEAGEAERGQVFAKDGAAEMRTGGSLAFYVRAAAVRGVVTLPHGMDALRPLHTATATVALERPVALEESQPFVFRQHGRAAGSGTVTRLLRQFPGVSR